MKNFSEFVKAHKEKIYAHAQSNTKRNSNGDAVISRRDPWFNEDTYFDSDNCPELAAEIERQSALLLEQNRAAYEALAHYD